MNSIKSTGIICLRNDINIEFRICKIEYVLFEDETFRYVFTPYYDVIDLLDSESFNGIPGLDLSLRKEKYTRENIVPVFISERVPSKNREDLYELLKEVDMDYMDPIVYLMRTKLRYFGDNLYVIPFESRKDVVLEDVIGKSNTFGISRIILENMARGNEVLLKNGEKLRGKSVFDAFMIIYEKSYRNLSEKQAKGIGLSRESGKYNGRKPKKIDDLIFLKQLELNESGKISSMEAASNLGITISKYYRMKKSHFKGETL